MEKLVFIHDFSVKSEPYTTSDIIAEYAEVKHHAIQQLISKYMKNFESYGRVAFEMRACPHKTGASLTKVYHLNEPQATFLMTLLKNTPAVLEFKQELVRQFFLLRDEAMKHRAIRPEEIRTRRKLTDAIKESPHFGAHGYKHLTDLAYKVVTGLTASRLKETRGDGTAKTATDLLSVDELMKYEEKENFLTSLVDSGLNYQEIKEILFRRTGRQ